jgi:hypothetical protein
MLSSFNYYQTGYKMIIFWKNILNSKLKKKQKYQTILSLIVCIKEYIFQFN